MKKLNKFFAILVALAMMATLCVSMAFAAPGALDASEKETAANDAYLTKYLDIDEGVTVPNATFTFNFAKATLTDAQNETMNSTTVKLSEVTLPTNVTINARDMKPSGSTIDNGALVGNRLLFGDPTAEPATTGIFDNIPFPHYGEYIYKVTESITNADNPAIGDFAANTQEYILHIYYTADGKSVTVEGVEDNPEYDPDNPGDETPTKPVKKDASIEDPSDPDNNPGNSDDKDDDEITQTNVEGFSFVNEYTLKSNYDPSTNPYGAFYAQKSITGAYGDKTQGFPITISVAFPNDYNGDKALNLYNKDGNPINGAVLADTATAPATSQTWAATVELADGDIAYFKNLPAGAVVTVNENLTSSTIVNAKNYEQSAITTTGDQAGQKKTGTAKTGAATDVAENFIADTMTYSDDNAKKKNAVEVTNENKYDPGATGILLSNLPYIALALVAIGGLVAYVVVRRRQDDEA